MRRALVVLALLTAACGDDGGLSREEYIAEGDAICRRFEELGSALTQPGSIEEIPAYIDQAIDAARTTVDDFTALDPPDDAADVHAAFVAGLEDGIAALEEAKTAAEGNVPQGVIDGLTEAGEAVDAAGAEARAYGFEVCGATP